MHVNQVKICKKLKDRNKLVYYDKLIFNNRIKITIGLLFNIEHYKLLNEL